ncbi:oxidoreductase [Rhodococcus koreensis]
MNISSVFADRGFARRPAYSASKHAIGGLNRSAAIAWAPGGIRINELQPGVIAVPRQQRNAEEVARIAAGIPIRRVGSGREIATAVAFLLSDEASYVTGAVSRSMAATCRNPVLTQPQQGETTMSTWFLTGSSRGLGRSIAEAVLAAGDNLVATARTTDSLDDLVELNNNRIYPLTLDVTDSVAVRDAVESAVEHFGRIDVVVNNAGYADVASIEDMTDGAFRSQVDVNFFGVVNVTRAVLPIMRAQGAGHIIQISSVGGRVGGPGLGAYQSAKWAVGGFSEVLAKEVAGFGIHVTVAEPGSMRTNWAGSSMATPPVSASYAGVIRPVIDRLRKSDGNQPGDPARIAQILRDIVEAEQPPVRLLLGRDAVRVGAIAAETLADSDAKWREVSESV